MKRLLILLALLAIPLALAQITCTLENSNTCTTGTKYLGVENDTGGTINAHAQNHSIGTYPNSLCCTTTVSILDRDCSDETLVMLSDEDNAHLENSTAGNYAVPVCLGLQDTGVTCEYINGSCTGSQTCMFSMSDQVDAHLGPCGEYDISVCCSIDNSPPTVPVLLLPANGNTSVFERYPTFDWTDSTDPDGDPIHYQIDITAPIGCAAIPTRNATPSTTTSVEELCVDQAYNWTVRACDDQDYCSDWASNFTFTIASMVDIVFTSNNTNFGSLEPSTQTQTNTNDTLDNDPAPLAITNQGNVNVTLDVRALGPLWDNAGLDTDTFQYADENSSSWNNLASTYTAYHNNLDYGDSRELEIRVEVPIAEPPGAKSSTIQAVATG